MERLGFAVPLHALSYWLRGVPDPDVSADAATTLGGFVQNQWQVQVEERDSTAIDATALPHKLTLTQGNARIRVIVDRWAGHRP